MPKAPDLKKWQPSAWDTHRLWGLVKINVQSYPYAYRGMEFGESLALLL